MSTLSQSFLEFLGEKYEKTGKLSFTHSEYSQFQDYDQAIIELSDRGVIDVRHDISGTISLNLPKN